MSSETRIRQGRCVSRIGYISDTDTPGIRPGYVSAACPRIPAYLGWKLRKGNVSAQSIRPSPTYHCPILCLCPTPDPSHAQSASRSRLRLPTGQLPHAAPVSAARRRPASALAGDKEPPRRRRRAAPRLQQRAPAMASRRLHPASCPLLR